MSHLTGEPLNNVLCEWFALHESSRNPLWLRLALARLSLTKTMEAALATARMVIRHDTNGVSFFVVLG